MVSTLRSAFAIRAAVVSLGRAGAAGGRVRPFSFRLLCREGER